MTTTITELEAQLKAMMQDAREAWHRGDITLSDELERLAPRFEVAIRRGLS